MVRPQGFLDAMDAIEVAAAEKPPFFLVADLLRPHEPGIAGGVVASTDEATGARNPLTKLRSDDYLHQPPAPQDEGHATPRGHLMDSWPESLSRGLTSSG